MEFLFRFKPGISKKALLFVAGFIWLLAGSILLFRAFLFLVPEGKNLAIPVIIGMAGGICFYLLLFSRISIKYISRIKGLTIEKPCFFSFFSWKAYLVMGFMITMGISMSKLHWLHPHELHVFFIAMSLPLLFSGIRFLYHGIRFHPAP